MTEIGLPRNVRRLGDQETFRFSCHPGVPCFTECCRQLDLALSPYDVLRLRRGLGIPAAEFLDRYAVVEKSEEEPFPTVFLAMVDDGRAACPFVTERGCSVYQDRPGACRAYPVGRGAYLDA
ncbi:MAG: YkgJ family cysteine cluster protein, partial [Desulfobulbaceae bacterium]|nr:YkgJ family cysteine cluster protein [Desulfobulbaceae bacterium]